MDITTLPCWSGFQDAGVTELHSLYRAKHRDSLPNTCKGATAWDSVLMCSVMSGLWSHAEVDQQSHMFDAHDPVRITFKLPLQQPAVHCWRLPVSWAELKPPPDLVDKHYAALLAKRAVRQRSPAQDLPAAFHQWGRDWEQAVHLALQEAHASDPAAYPMGGLGRQHRGRCKPRQKKYQLLPALSRVGRSGDFNPPEDPVSVCARQRTRQVRRLQTYLRNLSAHRRRGSPAAGQPTLEQQWGAVCRAAGYAPSFPRWLLAVACFSTFHFADPPAEWVKDVLDYVQFDCIAEVRRRARHREGLFKQQVRRDEVSGSAIGFQQLRGRKVAPLQALPTFAVQALSKAFDVTPDTAAYHCSFPPAFHIAQATLATGEVVQVSDHVPDPDLPGASLLQVSFGGPRPETCTLQQHSAAVTPEAICREFTAHWYPIWNRDTGSLGKDVFQWDEFLRDFACPEPQPDIHLDLDDLRVWQESLQRLQPGRATGVCGCAVAELKAMPPGVLTALVALFKRALTQGHFPAHLCKGTASCVPKVDGPQSISQCRPITVYSTLYRFFASTITRQVLAAWSATFPATIYGAMPRKSARDAALTLELAVEKSHLDLSRLLGFSVDLSRFFNMIPRCPMQFLLGLLGVPASVVTLWGNFLDRADRLPSVAGHLGAAIPSCTGVPEGDPLSILAQASINWALHQKMQFANLTTISYIDNSAWMQARGSPSPWRLALSKISAVSCFCLLIGSKVLLGPPRSTTAAGY